MAVCSVCAVAQTRIDGGSISIEFDRQLHSRVVAHFDNENELLGTFSASETISVDGKTLSDFAFVSEKTDPVDDKMGHGKRIVVTGKAGNLSKVVAVTVYDDFPTAAVFDVSYQNDSSTTEIGRAHV